MELYPYNSPIILTDAIFQSYGGLVGDTVPAQHTAAFLIAEKDVTEYLHTFLLPTTITGTYPYNPFQKLVTRYGYVNSLSSVILYSRQGDSSCSLVSDSTCAYIRDDTYGVLDVLFLSNCNCHGLANNPYQIGLVYNSGLPSGTTYQADILLALTMTAQIALNEIQGYGNEAPGDIGIKSFSNVDYSENRMGLVNTALGNSARANFIARKLEKYRRLRYLGL